MYSASVLNKTQWKKLSETFGPLNVLWQKIYDAFEAGFSKPQAACVEKDESNTLITLWGLLL